MRRVLAGIALALGLASSARPQETVFEVASVKVFDLSSEAVRRSLEPSYVERAEEVTCVCPVAMLIMKAYGLPWERIDLPEWASEAVLDFHAKIPVGGTRAQIPGMLRRLLSERWNLETRMESRETAVYALRVHERGLKLNRPHPDAERPKLKGFWGANAFLAYEYPGGRIHFEGWATLHELAEALNVAEMSRPVIDRTGIEGEFEILLDATLPEADDFGGGEFHLPDGRLLPIIAPSVLSEIQKLGLKLEPTRAPVDYLKILKIDRNPSGN